MREAARCGCDASSAPRTSLSSTITTGNVSYLSVVSRRERESLILRDSVKKRHTVVRNSFNSERAAVIQRGECSCREAFWKKEYKTRRELRMSLTFRSLYLPSTALLLLLLTLTWASVFLLLLLYVCASVFHFFKFTIARTFFFFTIFTVTTGLMMRFEELVNYY